MLKKLRRKFIAIAMLSVSIVLIAIVGTINIANYISTNQALDARLSLIADNGGTFPDMTPGDFGKKLEPKSDQPPAMNDLQKHGISQESPFDTRYFTVTIAPDGTVESVDTGKIASISAGTAEEYAAELWKKGKKKGFFADYKYLATDSDGSTMYVFLNCQREISTIRTYVLASVGTGTLGLVIVFVMIYFFSGKVLKPVSESYEKQKRFITDASHEIKTPLTIIDANTEVIEMMEGENEWTQSTRKQIARLTSLTEKLVFLSRMDEEGTKLEKVSFSLSDAVLDTAEGFRSAAKTKGKQFEINVAYHRPDRKRKAGHAFRTFLPYGRFPQFQDRGLWNRTFRRVCNRESTQGQNLSQKRGRKINLIYRGIVASGFPLSPGFCQSVKLWNR